MLCLESYHNTGTEGNKMYLEAGYCVHGTLFHLFDSKVAPWRRGIFICPVVVRSLFSGAKDCGVVL